MQRSRLLAVAALMLVAGCAPRSGQTPSGADGKPRLRLAFFPNVTHAAALYGTGTGDFAKALAGKASVEERVFTAGPAEIEALFAGEVDLGYIGPGPAVNGFVKSDGQALQIVAGAASGGAALVARKGVAVKGVKDLAGKRVAVPQTGGTQDISLRHALKGAGLDAKDHGGTVEVLQFAPADTLTQFERGTIDAAWLPEPWVSRAIAEGRATLAIDERTLWPEKRFATAVVIVRRDFQKAHPEIVAAFVAAHRAAVAQIAKDPDAARKVIGEQIARHNAGKAIPDPVLRDALSRTEITDDPLKESVLTFADQARELGYLRRGRDALKELFATP